MTEGKLFHNLAPPKERLRFRNSVWGRGSFKSTAEERKSYSWSSLDLTKRSFNEIGALPFKMLYINVLFCLFLLISRLSQPSLFKILYDLTSYGELVIMRAARFCSTCNLFLQRERETERERDRETERDRERQRDRDRETERDRERGRERGRDRETERQRQREKIINKYRPSEKKYAI